MRMLFQSAPITLHTDYSPDECAARLTFEPQIREAFGWGKARPIQVFFESDGFWVRTTDGHFYRERSLRYFHGRIMPWEGGSRIDGLFRLGSFQGWYNAIFLWVIVVFAGAMTVIAIVNVTANSARIDASMLSAIGWGLVVGVAAWSMLRYLVSDEPAILQFVIDALKAERVKPAAS